MYKYAYIIAFYLYLSNNLHIDSFLLSAILKKYEEQRKSMENSKYYRPNAF